MTDLSFSSRTNKVLKVCDTSELNCFASPLDAERIAGFNRKSLLESPALRKICHKPDRDIHTRTFIIPVDGGAVTGFLFEKPLNKSGAEPSSLIIFFHGGGWAFGNMEKHNLFCNHVCSLTGIPMLSVDYRLAPEFKYPTALEDCYETLLWAEKGARYWGIDPDKIYTMGDCAGGNLAIGVARKARDSRGPKIAGQALLCPVTDGRMRTKSYEEFSDGPILTSRAMAQLISLYQREPRDIMEPDFSPMLAKDLSRLPDTLVVTADHDVLSDDGKLFASALAVADTNVRLFEMKDTFHAFYHYPKAAGTEEFDNLLLQFFGGRALEKIELMTDRRRRRLARARARSL